MPAHVPIDNRILEVILRSPGAALDEVVFECPDLTWNQVFMAVDRLSRAGILKLTSEGNGNYRIHFSKTAVMSKVTRD